MTFWELVFIVKITTDSLSFQMVLISSICPQIQLRAVAQARLTPAGQRDQLPPLILMYTHIFRNIKQAVKESCMLCPREHNAPFPVLQQKVVFRMKVMGTPKTTNKPGPGNSRLPSRCWSDSNHKLLADRTCSFNWRAAAFLQGFHLHLLPQYSLLARGCFLSALQLPPHQTWAHLLPHSKLRQQCHANSTVSLGVMPALTTEKG